MSKASLAILTISSLSAAVLVAAVPQAKGATPATKPAAPATKPAEAAPPATAKAAPAAAAAKPATATAPAPKTTDGIWPREVVTSIGIATMYVPQVEAWDSVTLEFRAAVSLRGKSDAPPVYGVLWGKARTSVDKDARVVSLLDREFTKLVIPSAPDKQETWKQVLSKEVQPAVKTIALDRLAALLEVAAADKMAASVPVKTTRRRSCSRRRPRSCVRRRQARLAPVQGHRSRARDQHARAPPQGQGRALTSSCSTAGWRPVARSRRPWEVVKKADKRPRRRRSPTRRPRGQVGFLPGGNPKDAKTPPTLTVGHGARASSWRPSPPS